MDSLCALDEPLQYPPARRDDLVIDDYHGIKIADPYRRLEDPHAEEVKEFAEKQVQLTDSVLKKCETREKLRETITKLFDHPRSDASFRQANKYFYFQNTGLQPQDVLYVLEGEPEILLDPNIFSEDGTVSLTKLSVSKDAKYLAYALSSSGSDWTIIKVMLIEDKNVELDTLSWVKFSSIGWTHDSKGFCYSHYPAPEDEEVTNAGTETNANLQHELYYHFLGKDQSEDILCWRDLENPKYLSGGNVTDDGKYVLLRIEEGFDLVNKLYYYDLSELLNWLESFRNKNSLPFVKLIDKFDAKYEAIANDDTVFTFLTNKDTPKYKLVRVDLNEPTVWVDVLQESEDVLESACAVNCNQLIVSSLSDVKHILQVRDLKTGSLLHQLPIGIGTVAGNSARHEDSVVFFSFTSFLTPSIIYQCDLGKKIPDMKIFCEVVVPGFDQLEFKVD